MVALLAIVPMKSLGQPIKVIENIPYIENANYADDKDKLDLYIPQGIDNFPVVYFIHGGGLMRGDKSGQAHVGNRFAKEGFGVVIVNHRLSPNVSHPAHIEDIAASFAWTHKNIRSYGGDPGKIFVAGHSAGAYLAGLLALDKKYLGAHDLTPAAIMGVIPISGFFHVDRVAPARPKHVWGKKRSGWLEASPAKYVNESVPPMFCLYADGDVEERRKESTDLIAELAAVGHTQADSRQVSDRTHVTIWQRLNAEGDETSKRMVEWMRKILAQGE